MNVLCKSSAFSHIPCESNCSRNPRRAINYDLYTHTLSLSLQFYSLTTPQSRQKRQLSSALIQFASAHWAGALPSMGTHPFEPDTCCREAEASRVYTRKQTNMDPDNWPVDHFPLRPSVHVNQRVGLLLQICFIARLSSELVVSNLSLALTGRSFQNSSRPTPCGLFIVRSLSVHA